MEFFASDGMTYEEQEQFGYISAEEKAAVMTLYLIAEDGVKRNMEDVGRYYYGKNNMSFRVSLIHRAYNFSEKNKGRYAAGCKFNRTYNYVVSRSDIEAFIAQYPDGCAGTGMTFEKFLQEYRLGRSEDVYEDTWNEDYVEVSGAGKASFGNIWKTKGTGPAAEMLIKEKRKKHTKISFVVCVVIGAILAILEWHVDDLVANMLNWGVYSLTFFGLYSLARVYVRKNKKMLLTMGSIFLIMVIIGYVILIITENGQLAFAVPVTMLLAFLTFYNIKNPGNNEGEN